VAVFLLAIGVYARTLAPTISFWDCGEFITCSHIVGVPHQPGTPLYVLMGRVFDVVIGSPSLTEPALRTAWAVNFMSALFSALAVAFVYLIALDLARRADPDSGWIAHAGGIVGALFLLFSQTYWGNATEAEVYGLAAFIISLLTWLALRWYDAREQQRSELLLLLMIYMLGLGVGFHLGSLLVYPGIFLLLVLARRRRLPLFDLLLMSAGLALFLYSTMSRQNDLLIVLLLGYLAVVGYRALSGNRFALWGTLLFLFGLSVHLMMLIRAGAVPEPAINQTIPDTFATLMSVVRREQYPPINPFERQADLGWQFGYYYDFFLQQFYFIQNGQTTLARVATFLGPIFLGLLGVFHGIRRARPLVWMLVVNYLINGEVLTLYLNFTNHEVRERDYFYFAAFLFFAIFIGMGVAALLRYAAGPEGKTSEQHEQQVRRRTNDGAESPSPTGVPVRPGWVPKIAAVLLMLLAALPLLQPNHVKWFEHDRRGNRIAYEYAKNILAGLDENAIVFTNGDNDTFPIWYLQEVEHFRRDVTVVNLSLVNLPWYNQQLKRREPPLAMGYSNDDLERLRPRLFEDPNTGERLLVYVRDYVVHDIVTTNARSETPRPVFFAVTIPRENMERYFAKLQMEGLAYRLTETDGPDGMPTTDPQRLLENVFGVYFLDALTDGDTEQRQARFAAMAGWADDSPQVKLSQGSSPSEPIDYLRLMAEVGLPRTDVYRNRNTVHLLGNYPAALSRAGFEFIVAAESVAYEDTATYDGLLDNALASFEMAMRFDPYNVQSIGIYPLVLVEKGRTEEALAYLDRIREHVAPDLWQRAAAETGISLVRVNRPRLAVNWLNAQIAREPDEKFYYEALFRIFQYLSRAAEAQDVMERWERQNGERDPAMAEIVAQLRAQALEREQQRIDEAVEGGDR